MKKRIILLLLFGVTNLFSFSPMYICTSADSDFFPQLINLINSIHRFNFNELGQIAVFNLGLTRIQIAELRSIQKVSVHAVELVHPDLLKHFKVQQHGKEARGWYAWKPVAIKQGLDLFPYMLYIDAGLMILNPLDPLFELIQSQGYLFVGCGTYIRWMTPKHVIEFFKLGLPERKWILDKTTEGLAAGFMGLTRKMQKHFVWPIYEMAHNIEHFVDDGTTEDGFGTGRHDQVLFSIQARLHGLRILPFSRQGSVCINGNRFPCFYRNTVLRAQYVLDCADIRNYNRIRTFIRYKQERDVWKSLGALLLALYKKQASVWSKVN